MSDETASNSIDSKSDEKILELAKARFKEAEEYWRPIYLAAEEDDKFAAGEQWNIIELSKRKKAGRPAIVVNKLVTPIHQVENEMRQNKPAIKFRPGNHKASKETAKVFQGMVRAIEYKSNAQLAYTSAGGGAVRRSFGWFRLATDFVKPDSFQQEIQIKPIENQYSVKMDPSCLQTPDGSKAKWGFVEDSMSKAQFEEEYPDAEANTFDWSDMPADGWFTKDRCRICEYIYLESEKSTLYQIKDPAGQVSIVDKLPEGYDAKNKDQVPNKRESEAITVKWCKIVGSEIVERGELPGQYVPIIPSFGAMININGKWTLESLIRHSKDSQRIYNYNKSNEVEAISLAPKAPWVAAEGQLPPEYLNTWRTSNTENHAVLTYSPVTLGGSLAPPPQRNTQEPAIQAITQAALLASDDIKATNGMFDASLGKQSNETSGIAITRRNQQSQTSNFHFMDNLAIAIQQCGRVLAQWIPVIYDTEQVVSIIGEDGTHEFVTVNQEIVEHGKPQHILSEGDYDVYVDVGPSYQTQKQEAAETVLELMKSLAPEQSSLISDIMVKNLEIPDAEEISARLRKQLPPGMVEDKDQPPTIPPQVQQQLQQSGQMIEQLTQHLKEKTDLINQKTLELESKERIALANIEKDMQIAMLKTDHNEALAMMKADMEAMHKRMELLHFDQPIESETQEPGDEAAVQQGQQQ